METLSRLWQYVGEFFLEWEDQNILCSVIFFRKSCRLGNNVEKRSLTKEAAEDDMAARYMLDK